MGKKSKSILIDALCILAVTIYVKTGKKIVMKMERSYRFEHTHTHTHIHVNGHKASNVYLDNEKQNQ